MAFTVRLGGGLDQVPVSVRAKLHDGLLDVAGVVGGIPPGPLVMPMEESPVQLDVEGWHFLYEVDRRNNRLRVAEDFAPEAKRSWGISPP